MNFETCIPKNNPIVLYLTASVKLLDWKVIKQKKSEGTWNDEENHIGIKMHAAALYKDYVNEITEWNFISTSKNEAIKIMNLERLTGKKWVIIC